MKCLRVCVQTGIIASFTVIVKLWVGVCVLGVDVINKEIDRYACLLSPEIRNKVTPKKSAVSVAIPAV